LTPEAKSQAARLDGDVAIAVQAVARASDVAIDGWAVEKVVQSESAWATWKRHHVRLRLREAVDAGLLERRWEGHHGRMMMVTLEPTGAAKLAEVQKRFGYRYVAPTRPPRLDAVIHHVLVVEASSWELSNRGAKFLRLLGDESLRSMSRKGRILAAGARDESLPDGRLRMQEPGRTTATWLDIEIIVSKYTDEMIQSKCTELDPLTTAFYVPTLRLQRRVERLTGLIPHLFPSASV